MKPNIALHVHFHVLASAAHGKIRSPSKMGGGAGLFISHLILGDVGILCPDALNL
jgi:hypothetical protein